MAEGAGGAIVVSGAVRVGGVLEDEQLVFPGEPIERIHVGGLAGKMNRNERARAGRERGLDGLWVQVERVQFNVREHRNHVGFDHGGRGGEERVRRDDYFILGAQARGEETDAQGDGAIGDRDAVPAPMHGGEAVLEGGDLGSVQTAPLATTQGSKKSRLFGFAKDRPGREWAAANGRSSEECEHS